MAESPYSRLADVLRADAVVLETLLTAHTVRHRCRAGECEAREATDDLLKKISRLAREG